MQERASNHVGTGFGSTFSNRTPLVTRGEKQTGFSRGHFSLVADKDRRAALAFAYPCSA